MDYAKSIIVSIVTAVIAYLNPINNELRILALIFGLNFLIGLVTDILVNKERFKFRKAWRCIKELTVFLILVNSIYIFGRLKGSPDGALQCVSFVTYTIGYFYAVNCLRNLMSVFNGSKTPYMVCAFLYYLVSVEFVKKIPYLLDFFKTGTYVEQDNNTNA